MTGRLPARRDLERWDAFVASVPGGHHVQSSRWAAVKQKQGWEVLRVVVEGDGLWGGAQVFTRRLPPLGRIGYLDRGPVVDAPAHAGEVVDALVDAARRHRISPLLVQLPEEGSGLGEWLLDRGFRPSHVQVALGATVITDLTPPPEQILARMKSKTRYNIRRSLRSDLTVRVAEEADLPAFSGMLADTGRRQGFDPDPASVMEMCRQMGEEAEILLAERSGRPVAGILTIHFGGRVVYKRGAWTGEDGGSHPNERLHWEAMQRGRERGASGYDFDGIDLGLARRVAEDGSLPKEHSRTLTGFKLGFGGRVVILPAPLVRLGNPLHRWGHDRLYPSIARLGVSRRLVDRLRRG